MKYLSICLVGQYHWETRLCVLVNWKWKTGSVSKRWERFSVGVRTHRLICYVEGTNYLVLPKAGVWTSYFQKLLTTFVMC